MKKLFALFLIFILPIFCMAGEMPFINATASPTEVKPLLAESGFQIIGEYTPYSGTQIIVISHKLLQDYAAKTKQGGFAASLRVAISNNKVSYNNPVYQAAVYHLKNDLTDIKVKLKNTLGDAGQFGATQTRSIGELKDYHYMAFMPYFDDLENLNKFKSHQNAIDTVKSHLNSNNAAKNIYQIDIPNSNQTVIGFAIHSGDGADKKIMKTLKNSSAAHLPYELLITGKDVVMLHPKFRIAISAPDLTMGDFIDIMSAPDAIIDLGNNISKSK